MADDNVKGPAGPFRVKRLKELQDSQCNWIEKILVDSPEDGGSCILVVMIISAKSDVKMMHMQDKKQSLTSIEGHAGRSDILT